MGLVGQSQNWYTEKLKKKKFCFSSHKLNKVIIISLDIKILFACLD